MNADALLLPPDAPTGADPAFKAAVLAETVQQVLRGLDGQNVSIPREQVQTMQRFERSLMPEGLLIGLSDQELRDFFAYLRIPQPITR